MFCPNCGQQQNTQNLRFCSKCGLPLTDINQLVKQGGMLPRNEKTETGYSRFFTKLYGSLFGILWFIVFTLFLTSVTALMNLDDLPPFMAVIGVFGSMIIILFSLIVFPVSRIPKENFTPPPAPHNYFGPYPENPQQTLPPPPASDVFPFPNIGSSGFETGEIRPPGSVTENTTKLLTKEEEQ